MLGVTCVAATACKTRLQIGQQPSGHEPKGAQEVRTTLVDGRFGPEAAVQSVALRFVPR